MFALKLQIAGWWHCGGLGLFLWSHWYAAGVDGVHLGARLLGVSLSVMLGRGVEDAG